MADGDSKGVHIGAATARFSAGAIAAAMASAGLLAGGGPLALAGPPLAWFTAGAWASGALRVTPLARCGYGAALSCGAFASLLLVVSTQAWSNLDALPMAMPLGFMACYGIAAAVALLATLPSQSIRVYAAAVAGFGAGGLVAGFVLVIVPLQLMTALISMAIPAIAGGVASAQASARSQSLS